MPRKALSQGATLLRKAIRSAEKVEKAALKKHLQRPLQVVGLGHLVRARRIARAIERLGRESAYEALLLLRVMLEMPSTTRGFGYGARTPDHFDFFAFRRLRNCAFWQKRRRFSTSRFIKR